MDKTPTDILEEEHRFIQQVVGALPHLTGMLQAGQPVEPAVLLEIVEFMRMFADKCHHGKEEALLFPLLVQRGVPVTGCPIAALSHEHQEGRALVSGLAEATQAYARGEDGAAASVAEKLHGITELYPNHIWKEDYLLFPMTNKVLGADDHKALMEKFVQADATMGQDAPRRFEDMALELESLMLQAQTTLHSQ